MSKPTIMLGLIVHVGCLPWDKTKLRETILCEFKFCYDSQFGAWFDIQIEANFCWQEMLLLFDGPI